MLVSRFPEKGPELWAYHSTILNAAHSYEGATWVAYDRQYRREMLARNNLDWSVPNSRLYNEAFTGRALMIPRCQHCLSEDHGSAGCPQHPNPMVVGWFQPPGSLQLGAPTAVSQNPSTTLSPSTLKPPGREVCRNFNNGRCRFSRCRFLHTCADCLGPTRHFSAHIDWQHRPPCVATRANQPYPYMPLPAQYTGPGSQPPPL